MIETWEKIVDPNFLNADMIGPVGTSIAVTIADIDYRDMIDPRTKAKQTRPCLIFEERKPLVLNKTNSKTLMKIFGSDDPANCKDKTILLYVTETSVGGKQTTCVRIKEFSDSKCEGCGNVIKPAAGKTVAQLVEISKRNCGKALCLECMKKEKEKQNG